MYLFLPYTVFNTHLKSVLLKQTIVDSQYCSENGDLSPTTFTRYPLPNDAKVLGLVTVNKKL